MTSEQHFSTEFDAERIAEDVFGRVVEACADAENVLLLLFCAASVDKDAMLACLYEKFDAQGLRNKITLLGGTVMAFLAKEELSARYTIYSGSRIKYSVALTETLDPNESEKIIKTAYDKCVGSLSGKAKLILPFFHINIETEKYLRHLFSLAGDVPVFGGVLSSDFMGSDSGVFFNDCVCRDKAALLALGGDINPVCASSAESTPVVEHRPYVTKADGEFLYKLDNVNIYDYMSGIGLNLMPQSADNAAYALAYGSMPFIVDEPGLDIEPKTMRALMGIGADKEYAILCGIISEGSRITPSIITKENVHNSINDCIRKLEEKMAPFEAKGYKFTNIFSVSCVGRYFVYAGNVAERESIFHKIFHAMAFYSFGEICPGITGGKEVNRFNNAAIAMCAF